MMLDALTNAIKHISSKHVCVASDTLKILIGPNFVVHHDVTYFLAFCWTKSHFKYFDRRIGKHFETFLFYLEDICRLIF